MDSETTEEEELQYGGEVDDVDWGIFLDDDVRGPTTEGSFPFHRGEENLQGPPPGGPPPDTPRVDHARGKRPSAEGSSPIEEPRAKHSLRPFRSR